MVSRPRRSSAAPNRRAAQRSFPLSKAGDAPNGHGTHVCGSAAGAVEDPGASPGAGAFAGAAPGAKLAFDDLSADGKTLSAVPGDLAAGLFPHAHRAGARIYSASWGSDRPAYDSAAAEVDAFSHTHDDFLVVVSAGNGGPAAGSVGSPATAKNALAVGAGYNSHAALAAYGKIAPLLAAAPAGGAAGARRYPLAAAAFGPPVVVGGTRWGGQLVPVAAADACGNGTLPRAGELAGRVALIAAGACAFGTQVRGAGKGRD
jgi:hypothetical protein